MSPDSNGGDEPADDHGASDTADTAAAAAIERDPLRWVSNVLWPGGEARFSIGEPPTEADRPWWWASPGTDQPQLLVPADSMPAAAASVRRYHDGLDLKRWARSVAAELTMTRPDAAHRLLDDRAIVLDGPSDATTKGVLGGLHELFERNDLRFAISLARPKTNRKPVIQVLDRTGMVLGWAKVAWTPWTEQLVTNEARWLRPPSRLPLITPSLIDDTVVAGRRVVVASSVAPSRRPRLGRDRGPKADVLRAIAERGTIDRRPVEESAWWRSVTEVLPVADADERAAVERAVERADGLTFTIGAWHGDFTPWNVMTVRDLAEVIDWELAADEVPYGFDLCHHHTQVAVELSGLSPTEALDRSARLSPQGFDRIGVEPTNRSATWGLYLVELIRRTLALRTAGLSTDGVQFGAAATERLIGRPRPLRRPLR